MELKGLSSAPECQTVLITVWHPFLFPLLASLGAKRVSDELLLLSPSSALAFSDSQDRKRPTFRNPIDTRSKDARTVRPWAFRTKRASAQGVKLGPIGAQPVSAALSSAQQRSENAFIFWRFRRFQQAEKATGLQVVWSWRPDAGAKFFCAKKSAREAMVARKPGHQVEHEGNRNTIAQGKPECFG